MKKSVKIIVEVALLAVIVLLAWLWVKGIQKPVEFNKAKERREAVAIQRLKDIRTLQVAFKGETGKFASTLDSLKLFYETGKMSIMMNVGSMDDSLAVAHTEALKKKNKKLTDADLYKLYLEGDKNLVFTVENKIPVRDTVFASREDFVIDSLLYIPFSGGQKVQMEAITKMVSGVQVPLFEAKMPYKALLNGMDHQLIVNLVAEREDTDRYPGLKVGSITSPNNNAGNWE